MPTEREREYYAMGFSDGFKAGKSKAEVQSLGRSMGIGSIRSSKPKRKLSAWNKFVKANSKKKIYRFAKAKLKLKKMGIAFIKTPAGRKK